MQAMLSEHVLPAWLDRFDDTGWICQIKQDGHRLILSRNGGTTRQGHVYDLPHLQAMIPAGWVVDGELMAEEEGADLVSATLQNEPHKLRFVAFDVLVANGQDVRFRPLSERLALLAQLGPTVSIADSWIVQDKAHLRQMFDSAKAGGREGLMLKHSDSFYVGRCRRQWRKLKVWGGNE